MINKEVLRLLKCFRGSFINGNGEFVAHLRSNAYFRLEDVTSVEELECKVLEWLSRHAYKGVPYQKREKNKEFRRFMVDGMNTFLGTDFNKEDLQYVYGELGNSVDRKLTIKFITSGYDISALKGDE